MGEGGNNSHYGMWERRELPEARNERNDGLHHPRQNLDLVCQAKESLDGDGRLSDGYPKGR